MYLPLSLSLAGLIVFDLGGASSFLPLSIPSLSFPSRGRSWNQRAPYFLFCLSLFYLLRQ